MLVQNLYLLISIALGPTLTDRAELLAHSGRFEEALVPLRAKLRSSPRDFAARTMLANVYDALGQTSRARREIRKLLILTERNHAKSPSAATSSASSSSLYMMAQHILRHRSKDVGARDEVITHLRACIALDPSHDNAKHWLAHQLLRQPGQSRAAEGLLASIRLDRLTGSHPLDTLMLLGQSRERLADLDGATLAFTKTRELYIEQARAAAEGAGPPIEDRILHRFGIAQFQLCRLLLLAGRVNESLANAQYALSTFPPTYQVIDIAAAALHRLGRATEVRNLYKGALTEIGQLQRGELQGAPPGAHLMPQRVHGTTLAWLSAEREATAERKRSDAAAAQRGEARCSIERRASITAAEFEREFVAKNRPLLLRRIVETEDEDGVNGIFSCAEPGEDAEEKEEVVAEAEACRRRRSGARDIIESWPAQQRWSFASLRERHSETLVEVLNSSAVAYDVEFGGLARREVPLGTYLDSVLAQQDDDEESAEEEEKEARHSHSNKSSSSSSGVGSRRDPLYLFGHGAYDALHLEEDFVEPASFVNERRWGSTKAERAQGALWYAGPRGSGVSLHQHTSAWNALVRGRKRWYLLPPLTMWGPTDLPTREWLRTVYPIMRQRGDPLYECAQEEGEVIYVPGDWYHATLNVEPSIGIAIELGADTKLLVEQLAMYPDSNVK